MIFRGGLEKTGDETCRIDGSSNSSFYHGVMCQTCLPGMFKDSFSNLCQSCQDKNTTFLTMVIVFILGIFFYLELL
jgi:hypothetical protein